MTIKPDPPASAPPWVLTYGDMMSLLLCFFILVSALSEVKQDDKFAQAAQSLRETFGVQSLAADESTPASSPLIEQFRAVRVSAASDEPRAFQVLESPEGIHISFGGQYQFEPSSAALSPLAGDVIRQTAERFRGGSNLIKVISRAPNEPLPEDSTYADALDLSYARSRAVINELIRGGVQTGRIQILAGGSLFPDRGQIGEGGFDIVIAEGPGD